MKIADFHIHSPYAGGTSKYLKPKIIAEQADKKGVDLIATGDFTHPKWLEKLKDKLEPFNGLLRYKNSKVNFILQTEVNTIFKKSGKTHKIHHVILAPSFEIVEQINDRLSEYGRLSGYGNGRPDLHVSASELVEEVKGVSKRTEIIPAHVWTPWYSLFGSKVGFDSIKACYEDQADEINALETGLSADPTYCRMVSSLDHLNLVSCSDAHSPWPTRIGREATIFSLEELTYDKVIKGIREGEGLWGTFEFRPEEGKYNFNGHRGDRADHNGAKAIFHPSLTPRDKRCPICKKKLTIGVQDRVYQLADREEPQIKKQFKHFVPLQILIAKVLSMGEKTKTVKSKYNKLIERFGSEYKIWLEEDIGKKEIEEIVSSGIAEAILKVRAEEFAFWPPGYDGVYGNLKIGKSQEEFPKRLVDTKEEQKGLEDY